MKKIGKKQFAAVSATILGLSLLFLAGCNEKESMISGKMEMPQSAISMSSAKKMRTADFATNTYNDSFVMIEESAVEMESASTFERKLIKTGNITLEISSLSESEAMMIDFAKQFGGYITDSSMYEYSYNATVKIPVEKFEEAMTAAGELGKIKYRSVNSQDVTDEFYDLQTRLETKKIVQKKLESYLASAKDIKDLLEVERQLNNVTSDIEVMEGRMKRLTNQIDYSTLYISMNLPTGFNDEGFVWPDLKEGFREFGQNTVRFFASLFMSIFYIVIFGLPIIALIALLFWLLFGRVGLIIRLFKWLKWKK